MKSISLTVLFLLLCIGVYSQYDPNYEGRFNQSRDAITTKALMARDDLLYHAETAYTTYKGAGNFSFISESRWAISNKNELSTRIVADIAAPILSLKHLWYKDKMQHWYISSKFNVQTGYTGYKMAQKQGYKWIADTTETIPIVAEFGHELLVTHALRGDINCTKGDAYLLFTFGLGTYFGVNFNSDALKQPRYHFLANRTATMIDNGILLRIKFWCDGIVNNWLVLHSGIFLYTGSFSKAFAAEIHAEAEAFIFNNLSAKLGFISSFANYDHIDSKAYILPMADISIYFGKKRNRDHSLFSPSGHLF